MNRAKFPEGNPLTESILEVLNISENIRKNAESLAPNVVIKKQNSDFEFVVPSQSEPDKQHEVLLGKQIKCDCERFRRRFTVCSHIAAALLALNNVDTNSALKLAYLARRPAQPLKKTRGIFPKLRAAGEIGEKKVEDYLRQQGHKLVSLKFEAPCDQCDKIEEWQKFRKLPDGIARRDSEFFFYDSKYKNKETFWINVRDYDDQYVRFAEVLPTKIFFYVEATGAIYVHKVAKASYPKVFVRHDKNWVYDVKKYVTRLTSLGQVLS